MTIFLNFSPTSSHLRPLQVENCDSNSRLVVDEDDYGKFRLERVRQNIDPDHYPVPGAHITRNPNFYPILTFSRFLSLEKF